MELIIIPIAIIAMFGLINYLNAVIRSIKKPKGICKTLLYVLMQIIVTVLYVVPVIALMGYCCIVYFKPALFLEAKWFNWSIAGYFAVILITVIVGIILIVKQCRGYYDKQNVFMYAVKHRVIISFIGCVLAIVGMIFGLINFGMCHFKVISTAPQIEQYTNQKYLALDISQVDGTINGYTVKTSEKCKTLIIKADPERVYEGINIDTYASEVVLEGLRLNSATASFNSVTHLKISGDSRIAGNISFMQKADISVEGNSGLSGEISIADTCNTLNLKGVYAEKTPGIDVGLTYLPRTNDFDLRVENLSLNLNHTLEYKSDSLLTLNSIGDSNVIKAARGEVTVDTKNINLKLDGNLEFYAPNSSGAGVMSAGNVSISGTGNCLFEAADGSYEGHSGGTAIAAKTLTCSGNLNISLVGGEGATGATGQTGTTGATGKKGNNESQGKDSVYGYDGRPGGQGGIGGEGGPGGAGGVALKCEAVPSVSDSCTLKLIGGDGGNGGQGGQGGRGGRGGDGGDDDRFSIFWIEDMSGGNGGTGGPGGEGGAGGFGGHGGHALVVNGESVETYNENIIQTNGQKGANGSKGSTGSTGYSGAHGDGGAGG